MSDIDERTYDDEVEYDEEEEDMLLEEDMIEEVDGDDGMDGEIAEAGALIYGLHSFTHSLIHSFKRVVRDSMYWLLFSSKTCVNIIMV